MLFTERLNVNTEMSSYPTNSITTSIENKKEYNNKTFPFILHVCVCVHMNNEVFLCVCYEHVLLPMVIK